jgi:hypothetical protein
MTVLGLKGGTIPQWRVERSRPRDTAHVEGSVAPKTGGGGTDRSHYQRRTYGLLAGAFHETPVRPTRRLGLAVAPDR